MDLAKILEFIKCPYCTDGQLYLKNGGMCCGVCGNFFNIIEEIPILVKHEKLCLQEMKQLEWFNRHYSEFSKEHYLLENWRLSMINRIFQASFREHVKTYLDIGCGATGYTVIEAARRNKWFAFGVDISLEAMLKAKYLAKNQGVEHMTAFIVASAENLPFKPNSLDYVSAVSVLEHLEHDEKTLKGIYEIIKDRGYLYICVPNTYKRMWPFLWPIYLYLDYKIGHKRHYSIENLNMRMKNDGIFELERVFYNGHLIKLCQIIFDRLHLIDDAKWWLMENKDINKSYTGIQLNAIYRKK